MLHGKGRAGGRRGSCAPGRPSRPARRGPPRQTPAGPSRPGRLGRGSVRSLARRGETRRNRPAARRHEVDGRRLVPHDVFGPEVVQEHEHVERVHHAVEAAPEVGPHVVSVVPAKAHDHVDGAQVVVEPHDPDACAEVGRVDVEQEAQEGRPHGGEAAAVRCNLQRCVRRRRGGRLGP